MKTLENHPCFNQGAKHTHGRVHLPVAPKCNIQCNYCNRKYDCVNESRPGVTSNVLTPMQSLQYLKLISERLDNLSVVGIAGPGDAFANPEESIETLRLIKEEYPDMMLCLSTNGLELFDYIPRLAELDVTHVTITINGLDASRLAKIYSWVRFKKHVYRGEEGAQILINEQLRCIPELKRHGIMVKVNTIVIPGVTEDTIEELAAEMARLGVDTMNCIPMKPVADTPFADIVEPSGERMKEIFATVGKYLKPMTHCSRCRADAVGMLGQDMKECHSLLKQAAMSEATQNDERTRIAVASYEGMLVNQHLGEAAQMWVYEKTETGIMFIEKRACPPAGGGEERWRTLADSFSDCRAMLVGGAGQSPTKTLENRGIKVYQMAGLIASGLEAVFEGKDIRALMKTEFKCGSGCKGNAAGCA